MKEHCESQLVVSSMIAKRTRLYHERTTAIAGRRSMEIQCEWSSVYELNPVNTVTTKGKSTCQLYYVSHTFDENLNSEDLVKI